MNLPTKITAIRLLLIPFMIVTYCLEASYDWMFILTGGIFILSSCTDFIDGYIARKYKMVTALGKFLDPIADKILVVAGLIISIASNDYRLGVDYFVLICSIIIIAREFIISLFRQMAALKNCVLAADGLGKVKTTSTMIAIGALLYIPFDGVAGEVFWWLAIVFLSIATLVTVISAFNYIFKNWYSVIKDEKTKIEMITDEEVEFTDDLCIEALELCMKSKKYSLVFIQKKLNIPYTRAFKICFWIEVMGFIKIENDKKIIDLKPEDIDALKIKREEYLKRKEADL